MTIYDPPANERAPSLIHSGSSREGENRDSSGTTKEEEDSVFCTGEPALLGTVEGRDVERSVQ